jgi:hypothetical protein
VAFGASLTLLLALGCTPPDAPGARGMSLPDPALTLLAPDTVRSMDLHPGVVYRYLWSLRGPWAVHLVQARPGARCEIGLEVLRAAARDSGGQGHESVPRMVARAEQRILAAVNADFFTPEGGVVGTEVADGSVEAAQTRPTVAWRPGAEPWIGIADVASSEVRFGWPVDRARGDGVTEAVGGFPDLIDGGRRVGDLEVAARPAFAAARHPRTAIGWDGRTGTLWMVVVDGRQPPYSAGMTLPELTELFEALGADEALNLDGGGSTTLVLGGSLLNRPSDPTGERAVANALALVVDPMSCGR